MGQGNPSTFTCTVIWSKFPARLVSHAIANDYSRGYFNRPKLERRSGLKFSGNIANCFAPNTEHVMRVKVYSSIQGACPDATQNVMFCCYFSLPIAIGGRTHIRKLSTNLRDVILCSVKVVTVSLDRSFVSWNRWLDMSFYYLVIL